MKLLKLYFTGFGLTATSMDHCNLKKFILGVGGETDSNLYAVGKPMRVSRTNAFKNAKMARWILRQPHILTSRGRHVECSKVPNWGQGTQPPVLSPSH